MISTYLASAGQNQRLQNVPLCATAQRFFAVTLLALRNALRRELLRGLLLGPSALCCSPSAQALLPLLTGTQRFF